MSLGLDPLEGGHLLTYLWLTSATTDLTVNGISLCLSSDPSLVSGAGLGLGKEA